MIINKRKTAQIPSVDRDLSEVEALSEIAREVVNFRAEYNMSISELAGLAKVHHRTLTRLEKCWRISDESTLRAIAIAIGADPYKWFRLHKKARTTISKSGGIKSYPLV